MLRPRAISGQRPCLFSWPDLGGCALVATPPAIHRVPGPSLQPRPWHLAASERRSSMCSGHDDTASREEVARLSRRGFLRTAAATAAVVGTSGALAAPALAREGSGGSGGRHRVPPDQISIQLFTLRDQLAIDLEGTLATLAEIGYTRVEHAGFVGRTVQEFKAALDAAGLRATSGHVLIPQPFDPAAWSASLADANTLGSRFIVNPFFGINFGTGEVVRETAPWQAFARDLNRAGRMARDAGLKLGYHNHNWEFFRLTDNPSRTAYDVLTDATDPELVHLELDLFWPPGAPATRSPHPAAQGPGSAVPRQGHEPGGQLRGSRSGADR